MGDESDDRLGDGMADGMADEWMMRGEELGDEVREAGIWRACGRVGSDHNSHPLSCKHCCSPNAHPTW